MELWQVAAATAVIALGSFVQGSVGFGANLIAAPVLVLLDPRFVPGPAIGAALPLALLMTRRDREGVHLGEVRLAVLARIPATVLAALTVASLSEDGLALVFGVLVLGGVAMLASGIHVPPTRRRLIVAGALSGYMGTATSIGGPPMAMLYAGEQGRRLRGTLAAFFLVGTFLSMAALAATGSFGTDELALTALLCPGVVAGYSVSGWGARRLDAGFTRHAVLAVSAVSAVSVLVDASL